MPLTELPLLLREEPAMLDVLGRSDVVLSASDAARSLVVAGLVARTTRRPTLVGVATMADAERLATDLAAYLGPEAVERYPAWETLPFERVSPTAETMARRVRVLWRLKGMVDGDEGRVPLVVVAPVRALTQRLAPSTPLHEPMVVRRGGRVDRDALAAWLAAAGYRREPQVEHRGEFAVRGSIVDVFPAADGVPVRIDLWDDEVDRLGTFSVGDQRSSDDRDLVTIYACRELIATDEVRARAARLVGTEPWGREQWERLAEGMVFDGMESWLPWLADGDDVLVDRIGPSAQLVLCEPRRLRDHAAEMWAEEADLARTLARTWGAADDGAQPDGSAEDAAFPRLHVELERALRAPDASVVNLVAVPDNPDTPRVATVGWNQAVGDGTALVGQARDLLAKGFRLVAAADSEASAPRVKRLLGDHGLAVDVEVGPIERGCIFTDAKLAVLSESDLTGRRRAHRPARVRRDAERFFEDLKPGDFVVHHQHGVARYGGMVTRRIGGVERDYLRLDYRGDDRLFVPSDQIDAVRPYAGGDNPKLNKLGGGEFARTKSGVRAEVDRIAQELVVLYQQRLASPGHAYAPDTPWQRELEDAFPYVETPDQLTAIDDVKADMEAASPMDRLVCGDVGFGKTEVAIRAAFKALQDGKQVAVLVPTTLLAQQHYATFADRFAGYPVRVEVLSRFLTNAQAKAVVDGLASGEVDCVIGTHRLLSSGVRFKDLGLLIVDEEQRFGVSHKETIKGLQIGVDTLTLTATPIPRTLEMSLTGIRDLSLLNTPPADRQPILTYVGEYDERAVGEAIRRELLREGQVFFVHNRVRDIDQVAARLQELVPEARIAIAHGQMDEGTLEQVVLDFWDEQFDVLVCTTIIESGIDMPTVNTLVVDRSDLLGLGQLHQLRGRVGRAGQRAYAYLFTPRDRVLSEDAYERLKTIGEATELGSGFRIAMRDLEIRGAGNLLGTGQSGHVSAVGYDLYCQMVNEAVAELRGEPVREPAEIKLDLPVDAHLPDEYVPREDLRLEAYRRLAEVSDASEVTDIEAEWQDRYGPIPEPAMALLAVASLRAECARLGITEVNVAKGPGFGGPAFVARISPLTLRTSETMRLQRLFKGAVYKEGPGQIVLPVPRTPDLPRTLVASLRQLLPPEPSESS
jgi:transcription-repair coupling factor (superfamily II helicase)